METRTEYSSGDPIIELAERGLRVQRPVTIMGVDCGYGAPGLAIVSSEPALVEGNTFNKNPRVLAHVHSECIKTERLKDRTSVAADDCRRISEIGKWLRDHYDRWKPDITVMEIPFSGARGAMAIKGMAFATALSVSVVDSYFKDCLVLQLCSPYDTKRWCTGNPKAEKEAVISAVSAKFRDVPWPKLKSKDKLDIGKCEAIADSLAAILTFLRVPMHDNYKGQPKKR